MNCIYIQYAVFGLNFWTFAVNYLFDYQDIEIYMVFWFFSSFSILSQHSQCTYAMHVLLSFIQYSSDNNDCILIIRQWLYNLHVLCSWSLIISQWLFNLLGYKKQCKNLYKTLLQIKSCILTFGQEQPLGEDCRMNIMSGNFCLIQCTYINLLDALRNHPVGLFSVHTK